MSDLDSEDDTPAIVPLVRSKSRSSISSFSHDSVSENIDKSVPVHGWTDDEQEALIRKLLRALALEDEMAFHKRLNRVDWKLYSTANRQPEECKQKVIQIISKMRKFRTLAELLMQSLTDIRTRKRKFSCVADKNKDRNKTAPPTLRKRLRQNSPSTPLEHAALMQTSEKAKIVRSEIPAGKKRPGYARRSGPSSPSRPQSPYEIFIRERLSDSSLKVSRAKKLHLYLSAWSELPDTERLNYIDKALSDEQRYQTRKHAVVTVAFVLRGSILLIAYLLIASFEQEEIAKFVLDHPDQHVEHKCLRLNLSERNILFHRSISHQFHPEGYPGVKSGYKLYLMEETAKESMVNRSKQWLSSVSDKWKRLSIEERKEYGLRVRTMWKQYERAAQIFLDHCPEELREVMCSKLHKTPSMVPKKSSGRDASSARDIPSERNRDDTLDTSEHMDPVQIRKARKRSFSGREFFVSQNELEYLAQCPFSTIDRIRKKLRRVYKTLPPARQKLYDAMARKFGNIF